MCTLSLSISLSCVGCGMEEMGKDRGEEVTKNYFSIHFKYLHYLSKQKIKQQWNGVDM